MTNDATDYIRSLNKRTALINGAEDKRRSGAKFFYSSVQECIRMASKLMDERRFNDADGWLERGAQHCWGFSRPFGW